MSSIINKLPADLIPVIVERVAETILSNPSLSNRKAVEYGLLSKVFYKAYKKRLVCNFDASGSKSWKLEQTHFDVKRNELEPQQPEAITVTIDLNKEVQKHYVEFIKRITKPWKTQRLKTLNLSNIVKDVPMTEFPEPIFSIESLEELVLKGWSLNKERKITWPNLKRLRLDSVSMIWTMFKGVMESSSSSLENLVISDYKEPWKIPGYRMPVFKNLKTLYLDKCEGVHDNFFTDFSKQFPRLEELCLRENPNSRICVSSRSLQKIRLVNMLLLKEARFDVPNVVQFEFEGHYKTRLGKSKLLPKVSVKTRSEGWTSVVKLECKANLTSQLKQELEEFKACFDGSKNSSCLNHKWLR